jgi:hypothetical protein
MQFMVKWLKSGVAMIRITYAMNRGQRAWVGLANPPF